jgi:hypothetical protein
VAGDCYLPLFTFSLWTKIIRHFTHLTVSNSISSLTGIESTPPTIIFDGGTLTLSLRQISFLGLFKEESQTAGFAIMRYPCIVKTEKRCPSRPFLG